MSGITKPLWFRTISILSIQHRLKTPLPFYYWAAIRRLGIDEAQFFDDELPDVCNKLANKGIRVIVAGLDMDFLGKPFGPMPAIMAIAESVTKVHAVCVRCGNPALYSYRLVASEAKILLGEKETYEPRCRICYHMD